MLREKKINRKRMIAALICGMLGCICFGAGDWLMIYGDTAYSGSLYWLTEGVIHIASWRNTLAMLVAFPGIILYGIALFSIEDFLKDKRQQTTYHFLTAFGLTPWLCLHLFYIMILYLFAWMNGNGYEAAALSTAEALFSHLSWIVIISEVMMLPPFLYWFYLVFFNDSVFPKVMAASNPLLFYAILYLVKSCMPNGAFRIGFTNALMSESMFIWFAVMIIWSICRLPSNSEWKI